MESDLPHLITVKKVTDRRGNLSVLENPGSLPFDPVRVYWLYDLPSGNFRDGHAYYKSSEVIVALSGAFDVTVETVGNEIQRFSLSRPDQALLVPPMTWRRIDNFATNSVALIVADRLYDEADYIRDKNLFEITVNGTDYENE